MAALLDVRDLEVAFPQPGSGLFAPRPSLRAVRGVSFTLGQGRALGLVGESGAGKTTVALAVMRLLDAVGGTVSFDGADLYALDAAAMRARRRDLQIVFQNPYSSLDPRRRAADIVRAPLDLLGIGDPAARAARVAGLFARVGLRADQATLFPHQFSGGQRQRIAIARALATGPRLLVCDEPVSALDMITKRQILDLLAGLRDDFGLALLFVSHDLGAVRRICDEIAIMYLGRIVELSGRDELFARPRHPYTRALLAAAPSLAHRRSQGRAARCALAGEPPSPIDPPPGCAFAGRCPRATPKCRAECPELAAVGASRVACHFPG
ncbi:MAG TPA: ATP-binding cassette domain-containing protein [Hyphomicrobiales bacterium]|nr:ATP-binding cassette domain-containing protein [Kaistiaceae bacterium]HQF31483.1 ATP-binding cassette domain-containing protein [Hyphomicrobiales bacterium]